MLVFGPGLGATTVAASIAALSDVPEQHAGVASGTNTAAFQIGGALGSAVATTVAITEGLDGAFLAAAAFAVLALVASVGLLAGGGWGGVRGRRRSAAARALRQTLSTVTWTSVPSGSVVVSSRSP